MRDGAQHGEFGEKAALYARLARAIGKPYIGRAMLATLLLVGYVAAGAVALVVLGLTLPRLATVALVGIVTAVPLLVAAAAHATIRRRALRRARSLAETHDGFYEFYRLWAYYPLWTSKRKAADIEDMFASFSGKEAGHADPATREQTRERHARPSRSADRAG
jgi:hypothetical protein